MSDNIVAQGEFKGCKGRDFLPIAIELGTLLNEKNAAYGDSFNKCKEFLNILYPDGVPPEKYQDMLTIARVFDKLMRIATKKDAFGESPWRDIAGYAILQVAHGGQK